MKVTKTICFSFLGMTLVFSQDKTDYMEHLPGTVAKIEMIAIPSGSFQMGSPQSELGRHSDEGPIRELEMEGFWMSKFEVTWELYNLFIERAIDELENENKATEVVWETDAVSGATTPYVDMSLGMGREKDFPVVNVTQRAASSFCEWLSSITGHYYRLPTEAEWEYAARAGTNGPYHFGTDVSKLGEFAWFMENSGERYQKVGTKKPNAWGLYDMYGNVAEWTLDQYHESGYAGSALPFEPPTKEYPIAIRGGSFKDGALQLRNASRLASHPIWKERDPQFPRSKWWFTDAGFVGFRIVRPYVVPDKDAYQKYWIKNQY